MPGAYYDEAPLRPSVSLDNLGTNGASGGAVLHTPQVDQNVSVLSASHVLPNRMFWHRAIPFQVIHLNRVKQSRYMSRYIAHTNHPLIVTLHWIDRRNHLSSAQDRLHRRHLAMRKGQFGTNSGFHHPGHA